MFLDFLPQLAAFVQIVLIDLSLAGDNAIVVGMAAAGLPPKERKNAILIGIAAATILRIVFAVTAVHLLKIIGLTLAGGLLLLWVSWKLYEQLREEHRDGEKKGAARKSNKPPAQTLRGAITQIAIADVSMSLDNVLGVAGAAGEHVWILVTGLALSVVLMGAGAALVVKLLNRYRWLGYAGLLVIVYVALRMIYDGGIEVSHVVNQLSLLPA